MAHMLTETTSRLEAEIENCHEEVMEEMRVKRIETQALREVNESIVATAGRDT
jgi:hypothetical protein